MAKVFLICGRICCGKSVYAEKLRMENKAVLLSVDEIMLSMFGPYTGEAHDGYVERIQGCLFEKSVAIAAVGTNVILDWGFWTKQKRSQARAFYKDRGIACEFHYIDVSDEVWKERVEKRNRLAASGETAAYFIDRGLAAKFEAIFEAPEADEIDVWVSESQTAYMRPSEIEARSFAIIESELPEGLEIPELHKPVLKRVIHTTADFDYVENLVFSENAVERALAALKGGACIVTDTNMAKAGIHKSALEKLGGEAYCFMGDADVAEEAEKRGCTRAAVCMEKAARLGRPCIFAVGNAPTALLRICELIKQGSLQPQLVIGVPVGFVNVVQSKELLLQARTDYIVAKGRKGGSNVAAAICNALLYMAAGGRE